eukprot:TRINITY_DN8582_c0_g2_i1.p1 TRINITY_DN8582_c0_g2~~TRINITY_DN8582_c0_g2_i1.p1  ORF type:complete len:270 (+),score=93.98 TRINITY_DN8582_c0_g2_i1:65-874(+)
MIIFFFFKQKTAYEMLRSLVGSEMCIRDRYQRRVRGICSFSMAVEVAALVLDCMDNCDEDYQNLALNCRLICKELGERVVVGCDTWILRRKETMRWQEQAGFWEGLDERITAIQRVMRHAVMGFEYKGFMMTNSELSSLLAAIEKYPISSLSLKETSMDHHSITRLLRVLDGQFVHTLDLRGNCLGSDGAVAVANKLPEMRYLSSLNLSGCKLGRGLEKVLEAVLENGSLTHVDLSRNQTTTELERNAERNARYVHEARIAKTKLLLAN